MTSISQTIRKRYSCRDYATKPLDPSVLKMFGEEIKKPQNGPFGNRPRFVLISMETIPREEWKRLGTYGVIKNARLYLTGIIKPAPQAECDYGYCKEKLILQATESGINTCWLGGTFAISAFGQAAGLREGESLPTVTPIGYAADHRSLRDRFIRRFAGSDQRKSWPELFFNGTLSTPLLSEDAGSYSEALENVRLAPSASNKQPWRIIYDKRRHAFDFHISRAVGYRHLRGMSLQDIDMGIAMCHFELTVRELNLAGQWRKEASPQQVKSLEYIVTWRAEK